MSQQEHTLSTEPGHWAHGAFPANVRAGAGTLVTGDLAFKRFHSKQADALVLGSHCTMDGVHFDLGEQGRAVIGDYCYWTNVVLLCELEVRVGNLAINALAGRSAPDYRLLNLRHGERFQPQDMENLQPLPAGLIGTSPITVLAEMP